MKIMVSVITAPRLTDAFYLPQTLTALSKQLDADCLPLVTADAYKPEVPEPWRLQSHDGPERRGSRLQMRAVFEAFIASDCQRLLYCEDDVIPCKNLIEYTRRIEMPGSWPLISFFDARIKEEWQAARVIAPMPVSRFLFTQCFVTHRSPVERLLNCDFAAQPRRIRGPNGSDSMLRGFFKALGYTAYGLQIPNLITHVGEDSIVVAGPTKVQQMGCWRSPGPEFDCLTLTKPNPNNTGPSG